MSTGGYPRDVKSERDIEREWLPRIAKLADEAREVHNGYADYVDASELIELFAYSVSCFWSPRALFSEIFRGFDSGRFGARTVSTPLSRCASMRSGSNASPSATR